MSEIPVPLTMAFTDGWSGCGLSFKELDPPMGLMMVGFWDAQNVYEDSCAWTSSLPDPPTGRSVDDLMSAIDAQTTSDAGTPADVSIDGFSGKYVRFEVPVAVDVSNCDAVEIPEFRFWNGPGESVWWLAAADAPGLIGQVWALEVGGLRVVVQGASYADAPESRRDEIRGIVESIDFQP